MFYPEETSGTERSEIDTYASQELKLDGTSRLMSLPNHRILLLTENGEYTMITIRFDQAEIDVAEAIFQPIKSEEKITASSMCFVAKENDDFDIFLSSHYHDATLMRLGTVKDQEKIVQLDAELDDSEKRQRINSAASGTDMLNTNPNFIRRKKQLTHYEALKTLDVLPTISPISDACQIPSIAGTDLKGATETQFSMDFLIGSGNAVKSYLTFAAASVPLVELDMKLQQMIPAVDVNQPTLRVLRVMSCQGHMIVNYTTTTDDEIKTSAIQTKTRKLVQVREDKLQIKYDEETLACFSLPNDKLIQVCPTAIRVVSTQSEDTEQAPPIILEQRYDSIEQTCMDPVSQTLFTLVKNISGNLVIQAKRGPELFDVFDDELMCI